jgi:hypothetical protein
MPVLQSGQRLGSYVVENLLGMGGMAEVYRGTHTALERNVAIKVLNPAFNADPTFPLRFLREAKTVARLSHPNIITVYDFGETGDLAYLVMEVATGGTFGDRAARYKTLRELVDGLGPVGEALQYAHNQGVVHRDLKPENILLADAERSLLADFGLARIRSESLDISEEGMILGTPHYMAPEQAMGEDVDNRADIYALGIMTYELLTGEVPFNGQTFFAIVQRHLKSPPPSIREVLLDAPVTLDAAIKRALAKTPRERFDSVASYMAELRRAADEAPALPIGRFRPLGAPPAAVQQVSSQTVAASASVPTTAPSVETQVQVCPVCGRVLRTEDMFCRGCGTRRSTMMPAGSHPSARTVVMGPDGPADGSGMPPGGGGFDDGRRTMGITPPAGGAATMALGKRRRPTSFNQFQWVWLGAAVLAAVFVNAVGLWVAKAGRGAAEDAVASSLTLAIWDNLRAAQSIMTTVAVLFAGFALFSMRTAIVDDHHLSPETYRRLRQYHRMMGYSALIMALAVGLLYCLGVVGVGAGSTRSHIHSFLGTALLVVLITKIIVVRYVPSMRRHLKLLGQTVFVLFVAVFATSTIPWVWNRLNGEGDGYDYYNWVAGAVGQVLTAVFSL